MIIEVKGNIFNILEEYNLDAIANPVNCVGVMGKGLALEFKNRYPANFNNYKLECENHLLNLNLVFTVPLWKVEEINNKLNYTFKYIINFPTKYHWKDKSDLNQISNLLNNHFINTIVKLNIKKIGLPYLGCGLGEIDKEDFKTELYKIHDSNEAFQNIEIYLVEYAS